MVKAYLRYVQEASWGVVVSRGGHVAVTPSGLAVAPMLEAVGLILDPQRPLVHRQCLIEFALVLQVQCDAAVASGNI